MSMTATLARSKKDVESWRYTDLEKLLARQDNEPTDAKHSSPACARLAACKNNLVFINGVWDEKQSHFTDLPKGAIQGSKADGYVLNLAGQTCLALAPIELLFLTTADGDYATKLKIELGASGRLNLIQRHENAGHVSTHTVDTEIVLHAQAKLVHGKIMKGGEHGVHIGQTHVHIDEGAFYDNFTLIKGGRVTRNEINPVLAGAMAQCTINGAMLVRGRDHADTTTFITHAAPHGTSREIYKSVLAGKARAVFQGKILVKPGAQKTDGHQLSRALLLSDQAEMDAKPELEIYADDVKCSHGCTVGDLDADSMFYLRSRGLSLEDARAMLTLAFVHDILDEIHDTTFRELALREVEGWLHEQI